MYKSMYSFLVALRAEYSGLVPINAIATFIFRKQ
jgi:hypothetical protein